MVMLYPFSHNFINVIVCDIACIEMLIVTALSNFCYQYIVIYCILDDVVVSQKDPNTRPRKIGSKFASKVNWKDPKLNESFELEFSQLIARYVTMYIKENTA